MFCEPVQLGRKHDVLVKNLRIFKLILRIVKVKVSFVKDLNFHEAPHIVVQLYGVPHIVA
jgi:hypothetical protein